MKAIELLVNSILPPDLRGQRPYDKKHIDKLLAEVAVKYPEKYAEIAKGISDIGRNASYFQGETINLNDMKSVIDRDGMLASMDKELATAGTKHQGKSLVQARSGIQHRYREMFQKQTIEAALAKGNNIGNTVVSGARGNPVQLQGMLTTPAIYTDYKDRDIPIFVRHSFGEGLRPAEYLASTFGVRRSVLSTKNATAKAGDLCLHQDTLVRVPGEKLSIAIRNLKVGDVVIGSDIKGNQFPVMVTNIFNQGLKKINHYRFYRDGHPVFESLICTENHKFLVKTADGTAIKSIGECGADTLFLNPKVDGSTTYSTCKLIRAMEPALCMDIEVNHVDHLFCLEAGVICSNSKQLAQSTTNLIVTNDDCGTSNGVDMAVDDPDLKFRVLARDVAGAKAGDVVDKHVLAHLRQKGIANVLARSTTTCQAPDGICAHCFGELPNHHFPPIGYAAGMTAAQAIGEPLAQNSLNTKHLGGASTGGKKTFSGFAVLNQFLQSPETFPHKAAVAEIDGKINKIEDAPQGGKYITIGEHRHYALPGYEPLVKVGDEVEQGDSLSEGIADAADIVRLRGLGEARKYYADRLGEILQDSGIGKVTRRNLDLVARGALDSVRITDNEGIGDYLPDDVVSYNKLMQTYSPPKETTTMASKKAIGQFLEQPALHYTVGTRITPRIAEHMHKAGFTNVAVSPNRPAFMPEMMRLRGSQYAGDDWMAKLHTSLLGRNIEQDAGRSRDTNVDHNVHFAPRLAKGEGFGDNIEETGEF